MFEGLIDNTGQQDKSFAKGFIANVFSYMFLGLSLTAVVAWWFSSSGMWESLIDIRMENGQITTSMNMLGYIVAFAPLGISLIMQWQYQRFSQIVLLVLFGVYASLLGMSLSFILLMYTGSSIAITFGVTAATFGSMALLGYTTKVDLTKFGSIMMMAFWGIFIASIVNFFMQSETMDYVISMVGVLVFTGLTAYFMQNMKKIAEDPLIDQNDKGKLAIIGGLQLYILFINLFLTLLRFLGDRE